MPRNVAVTVCDATLRPLVEYDALPLESVIGEEAVPSMVNVTDPPTLTPAGAVTVAVKTTYCP